MKSAQASVPEPMTTIQNRFDAQIAPELDVRQAESNLASTESSIPTLRIFLRQAIHRLAVLVGEHPGALNDLLEAEKAVPSTPEKIALGVPADILRQRPDIRAAERALAAQTAQIGVATADLYPRFSLMGSMGYAAFSSGDLLDPGSRTWSFGPSVSWSLFTGGRIRSNIRAEDALTEQALLQYEQTVLLALEEVENALVSYVQELERRDTLGRAVTAAQQSVALVTTLAQIAVALGVTYLMGLFLDWPFAHSMVLGFTVALSSTAVAIKMLDEIGEKNTRVGQVTIAILIAQDLAVVPMMLVVGAFKGGGEGLGGLDIGKALLSIVFLGLLIVYLSTIRIIPIEVSSEQLMRAVRLFQPYREGPAQVKLEEHQITWRDLMGVSFTVTSASGSS